MQKLQDRILKLKQKQKEKVTPKGLTTHENSIEENDSIFDFIIGGALIVVAFVFGRGK